MADHANQNNDENTIANWPQEVEDALILETQGDISDKDESIDSDIQNDSLRDECTNPNPHDQGKMEANGVDARTEQSPTVAASPVVAPNQSPTVAQKTSPVVAACPEVAHNISPVEAASPAVAPISGLSLLAASPVVATTITSNEPETEGNRRSRRNANKKAPDFHEIQNGNDPPRMQQKVRKLQELLKPAKL